ncbi:MAG: argininosuccinate lyase [Planctomycetota bacterium]|nr:argininosuccinate lyase [Planctomycetota bacterium]
MSEHKNSPSRSGTFESGVDKRVEEFTESISFDHRLYEQDIAGSIAHSRMLAAKGILNPEEFAQIETALCEIRNDIQEGKFEYDPSLEDIHMHIEKALIERLGDIGRKLHTGRSRNDQVSTDFRLWVRDAMDRVMDRLRNLQTAFLGRCKNDQEVILPAYTHMQRAQPVLAPHYWLAYCEKLERDHERLSDARKRVNSCTLGTAAVAGTTIEIDRQQTAQELGFERIVANSLDASSDRDFALESAFCLTTIALHLSTWAEEWILWSTSEFNFLKLPQEYCTGSSIMPQKINPDILELIRGKTARVVGNLQTLIVLTKSLPLAYNRDLQEDKPQLFDSFDTVEACLELATSLVEKTELNLIEIHARLERGFLDATTLMEYLIKKGVPQRTAHHAVGALVRLAMNSNKSLSELSLESFQEIHSEIDSAVFDSLGVENALKSFQSYGSTAPVEVARQIEIWTAKLK